jgi:hypothetical protein
MTSASSKQKAELDEWPVIVDEVVTSFQEVQDHDFIHFMAELCRIMCEQRPFFHVLRLM